MSQRRLLLLLAAPVVLAALLLGCNGDDDSPSATGTQAPLTTENGNATPTEFELARDAFYQDLDSYGANIGVLPDDIRDDLLASCRALEEFAAGDGRRRPRANRDRPERTGCAHGQVRLRAPQRACSSHAGRLAR